MSDDATAKSSQPCRRPSDGPAPVKFQLAMPIAEKPPSNVYSPPSTAQRPQLTRLPKLKTSLTPQDEVPFDRAGFAKTDENCLEFVPFGSSKTRSEDANPTKTAAPSDISPSFNQVVGHPDVRPSYLHPPLVAYIPSRSVSQLENFKNDTILLVKYSKTRSEDDSGWNEMVDIKALTGAVAEVEKLVEMYEKDPKVKTHTFMTCPTTPIQALQRTLHELNRAQHGRWVLWNSRIYGTVGEDGGEKMKVILIRYLDEQQDRKLIEEKKKADGMRNPDIPSLAPVYSSGKSLGPKGGTNPQPDRVGRGWQI